MQQVFLHTLYQGIDLPYSGMSVLLPNARLEALRGQSCADYQPVATKRLVLFGCVWPLNMHLSCMRDFTGLLEVDVLNAFKYDP